MLNKEHSITTRKSLPGGSCEEIPPVPATLAGRVDFGSARPSALVKKERVHRLGPGHPFVLG